MKLPTFDEFYNTLTKEEISSWINDSDNTKIQAKISKDGEISIDLNEFMGLNLYLTQRMLNSYFPDSLRINNNINIFFDC